MSKTYKKGLTLPTTTLLKNKKQARRHKTLYNLKVRKATLKPGNRVLVKKCWQKR
jgi:hypothetical protein